MSTNSFLTTPIFYVNDIPHIGHAYTMIAGDVLARFMSLNDQKVKYLTGTDEHGQKIEKAAISLGISTQELIDKLSGNFLDLADRLNIKYSDFIRTTENRHKIAVLDFWGRLEKNNDIYLGKYQGWYSVRDEAFYTEQDLTETGLAPTGAKVEWVEESSYFFALSKYQDKLLAYYEANPDFIWPHSRRQEIINFVKGGLRDLSISRTSVSWGIPVPNDPAHVIYVWVDALVNYITSLGYPDNTEQMKEFWPGIHIVGKDILKFHAIYWPAFLMSANLPLPKMIVSHGWWTKDGEKMSKSLGNVINPNDLIDEFGLDPVRYFLMREISFGNDGNFAKAHLVSRNNAELVNKIGNFLQRTAAFAYKYCNDSMETSVSDTDIDEVYTKFELINVKVLQAVNDNCLQIKNYAIHKIIENILHIAESGNVYIDQMAPWKLVKTDQVATDRLIYALLEVNRCLAIMLQPFIPESAKLMLDQLGIPTDQRDFHHIKREFARLPGKKLDKPIPIFTKFDTL